MVITRATELLGLDYPIVLAPMAGVSGGQLAGEVSRAGGLGLIGGGYADEPDWLDRQFAAAAGARVGCGFITWSLAQRPGSLGLALKHEPVAVMLSFGDPAPFAEEIHAAGAWLLCQVQNRDQAARALDVGADVVLAQGSEAGGHGYGPRSTMTLVPEIVDLAYRRGSDAVVLAAGGIADGRGLAAALMLGASGTLVGSRFYAAAEALSTPQARDRVATATGDDACRTTIYDLVRARHWPGGHTMNVLANTFTRRWHDAEDALAAHITTATAEFTRAVAEADYDTANVTVGQAAGLIDSVEPAADIVTSMAEQATTALSHQ